MDSQRTQRTRRPRAEELLATLGQERPSRLPTLSPATPSAREASQEPARKTGKSSFFSRSKHDTTVKPEKRVEQTQSSERSRSIPAKQEVKPTKQDSKPSSLPRAQSRSRPEGQPSSAKAIPTLSKPTGLGIKTMNTETAILSKSMTDTKSEGARNVLRRKGPVFERASEKARTMASPSEDSLDEYGGSVSLPGGYQDPFPGAILGMTLPSSSSSYTTSNRAVTSFNEQASLSTAPPRLYTEDLPIPSTTYTASTASSSSRFSDSPGPFSSRGSMNSTPTSISSYSPGIVHPSKVGSRLRQPSPTLNRPPVSRRKGTPVDESAGGDGFGLPVVQESSNSSSSGSTVKPTKYAPMEEATSSKPAISSSASAHPSRQTSQNSELPSREKKESQPSQRERETEVKRNNSRIVSSTDKRQDLPRPEQSRTRIPPVRPSRKGTPNLDLDLAPVIQSNLTRIDSVGHRRRESGDLKAPDTRPGRTPTSADTTSSADDLYFSQQSSHAPSRRPTPSPHEHSPATRRGRLDTLPKLQPSALPKSAQDLPSSTTSSSKSPSRFGFLHRRPKATPTTPSVDPAEWISRKGPAAGTGHEGYGKYAQRGRRPSRGESSTRGRSTSTAGRSASSARTMGSRKSSFAGQSTDSEMDDFILQRLDPVILRGDGRGRISSDSEIPRSDSELSLPSTVPSLDHPMQLRKKSSRVNLMEQNARVIDNTSDSEMSAAEPTTPFRQYTVRSGAGAQREVAGDMAEGTSTLAARRSLNKISGKDSLRVPAPINTRDLASSPSINSYDTSASSAPATDSTLPPAEELRLPMKKAEKKKKTSKWNFFQRSNSPVKTDTSARDARYRPSRPLPAAVSQAPVPRPVAHYAMMDASDQGETDTLEDLLHIVEDSPSEMDEDLELEIRHVSPKLKRQHGHSILLPSPPSYTPPVFPQERRPSSPRVQLYRINTQESTDVDPSEGSKTSFESTPATSPPRPSRLTPVGRIPQVRSTRDRQLKPSAVSFSRPFVRRGSENDVKEVPKKTAAYGVGSTYPPPTRALPSPRSVAEADQLNPKPFFFPSEPAERQYLPHNTQHDEAARAHAAAAVSKDLSDPRPPINEFLVFPPRKDSQVTLSTVSAAPSWASVTAIAQPPNASDPVGDDIWNEYDDLIDHVLSPVVSREDPVAQSASPFNFATIASRALQASVTKRKVSPVTTNAGITFSETIPSPQSAVSHHLRRSQILSGLRSSSIAPSTPLSMSEFIAGYGDRNLSSVHLGHRRSRSDGLANRRSGSDEPEEDIPATLDTTLIEASEPREPLAEKTAFRSTVLLDLAERSRDGPIAHANLKYGALMTSRWLSFGRVLFSPAHYHIQNNRQDRILILDGLGNDDWSYYCALTYPTATFYNLTPSRASSSASMESKMNGTWQSPPNHRQIYHPNLSDPFPFPSGFFTAAVFRFPLASRESTLRNAISECKRVLRPGGYLEMSMLDLDLLNMGNRARRAVRMLKTRMQVADPDISLKPTSDNVLRLLGKKGFDSINRCMVSLPVGGRVRTSSSGSNSDSSTAQSINSKDVSLSDLLAQPATVKGDASITKLVARVGRWWYTRCYESKVLPEDDLRESLWEDRALLRECERMGTGFKLCIAFAQRPASAKRRTMSV